MGTWEKVFYDGSSEIGRDEDIENKKASWSKGRLEKMKACWLYGFMCEVFVHIPNTEWHQFDRYEIPLAVGQHEGRKIIRALQAEIKPEHVNCVFNHNVEGSFSDRQNFIFNQEPSDGSTPILIEEENVGKWLTVTIDFKGTIRFCFTDKGKYS